MAATSTTRTGTSRAGADRHERWWAAAEPRAAMLLVHGIAEHSGRYEHVGSFFADRGIDVLGFDLPGHGESAGRRGHVDSFGELLDEVDELLAERRTLGVPVILLGHSLGGLISATYAASGRPEPDLLVLSAPALAANVPAWQRLIAPVLSRLAPTLAIPNDFDGKLLSRDPEVGRLYRDDPLRVRTASPRLFHETMAAMADTSANLVRISVPTYVVHGSDDLLVPVTATAGFEPLDNATRRVWGGLRHESLNEPEHEQVLTEIAAWLDLQLADRRPPSN